MRAIVAGEEPVPFEPLRSALGWQEPEAEEQIYRVTTRQMDDRRFLTDTRRFHSHPDLDPRWHLGRERPILNSHLLHATQQERVEAREKVLQRVMSFGVDVAARFGDQLQALIDAGAMTRDGEDFCLTREALLKVDSFLEPFFLPHHQDARYA